MSNRFAAIGSALISILALGCQSTPDGPVTEATIASGVDGGTYHGRYAPELDRMVPGWTIDARSTGGSSENLDLLADGKVDLALSQADVYASRTVEEPAVFGSLTVLGSVADECVFIAYWKEGAVNSFDDFGRDIGSREPIINLGTDRSGMAETWNYIVSRVPEAANTDLDESMGERALDRLVEGRVDAVAWVTDPSNPYHVLIRRVREDSTIGLMSVDDDRLTDVLYGDVEVFQERSIPVPGSPDEFIETVCMSALLLSGPQTPPALVEALQAAGIGR